MSTETVTVEPAAVEDLVPDDEELAEDQPEPESRITPDEPPES
jgi:hypothetical protein